MMHCLENNASTCSCLFFLAGTLSSCMATAASEPAIAANQQLAMRLACNCFKHTPLRSWVVAGREQLLDAFAPACSTTNKVRLGVGSRGFV